MTDAEKLKCNPYEPDLMCNSCRIKAIRQSNKLLEFVKEQYCKIERHTEGCFNHNYINCERAKILLKEIGEL